jgi:hypothetical protein
MEGRSLSPLDDALRWSTLLRVPFALMGLAGAALFLYSLMGAYSPILIDYAVWGAFLASSLAVVGDMRRHCSYAGHASTLSLEVIAFTLLIIGRLGSTAYALWEMNLQTPIVGGGATLGPSVALASLVALGGVLASIPVLLHAALGHPVVLKDTAPYRETLVLLRAAINSALGAAGRRPVLAAFAIGFAVRLIPEVIYWPWPIGWDTFEYIARLNDFIAFPNPFSPDFAHGMMHYPPLVDVALAIPGRLFGSWAVFKAFPPIAYGAIAALIALTSKRALKMNDREALLAATVSAFFILNLRISWDYQKQVLGTIMLMAALVCIRGDGSFRRHLGVSALLMLAAMASQVTAVAAVPALLLLMIDAAKLRRLPGILLHSATLTAVILALQWYAGGFVWGNATFGSAPAGIVTSSLSSASTLVAYIVAGFGVVLVPAMLALRSYNRYYLAVIATMLAAGISPIFMPYTSLTAPYRFLIEIAPFMAPLAVKGILSVKRRSPAAVYSIAIILVGCCFLAPGGQIYTRGLTDTFIEFPPSMQPDPQYDQLLADLTGFSANLSGMGLREGVPIITPYYLYRYVHLGIINPEPGSIVSVSSGGWPVLNQTVSALNASSFYYFADVDPERFFNMLESMSNSTFEPITFTFSTLREGIYCLYEVNRSAG